MHTRISSEMDLKQWTNGLFLSVGVESFSISNQSRATHIIAGTDGVAKAYDEENNHCKKFY